MFGRLVSGVNCFSLLMATHCTMNIDIPFLQLPRLILHREVAYRHCRKNILVNKKTLISISAFDKKKELMA